MKDLLKELLETVALALVIFFLLQSSLRNYRVELSSMEGTLYPKDRLVVNKLVYYNIDNKYLERLVPFIDVWDEQRILFPFQSPRRGDIIVFQYPLDPNRDFVKRVVGLPGEMVTINNGYIFINGEELDEPYLGTRGNSYMEPTLIEPNSYFVLGDNREGSSDSRYWGNVGIDEIVGKVMLRYWPFPEFSLLAPDHIDENT
jgi:signal peptidase I